MNKRRIFTICIIIVLAALAVVFGGKLLSDLINKKNAIEPGRRVKDAERDINSVSIDGTKYQRREGIESYLLIGLDSLSPQKSSGSYYNKDQADYLLLVSIDSVNKKVNFLTINRDTMCKINQIGIGGHKTGENTEQIALSHTYGDGMQSSCENTLDAVSDLLFGTKIEYYASITMNGAAKLNDYIGGVTVDDKLLLGDEALTYVRGRIGVDDSTNIARMNRQTKYMSAFVDKLRTINLSPSFVDNGLDVINDYLLTNVDLLKVYDVLEDIRQYEFGEIISPDGRADYSGEFAEFYVDENSLKKIVIDMFY